MFGNIHFLRSCLLTLVLCGSLAIAEESLKEKDLKASKFDGAEFVRLDNGYRVWTKRVGSGPIKILTLHGGPGCTHEYFECMEDFFPKDQFQIIYYDQLGSYYSDQPEDPSLWTVERFCKEVEQVRQALGLDHFYLYGQSWGGLLAIEYSLKYQQHLKGVILSNITGSVESYVSYINQLRSELPQSVQDRLSFYEEKEDYFNPEYEKTMFEEVYSRHLCRLPTWPEPFLRTFSHLNPKVYLTIQGPNEFVVTGNFKDWNRWNDLHKITVPALIICGRYDTMNPKDIEKMGTLIPHATVKICENGSHGAMYDDQKTYFQALHNFISDTENGAEMKPHYLYKVLSIENWKKSQAQASVALSKDDEAFIHLSKENQLDKIIAKYWANASEFIVLKIDADRLPGKLIFEANPGGSNKYYHLYEGSIPLNSIVEAKIVKTGKNKGRIQ